jgi:hypothetical protein
LIDKDTTESIDKRFSWKKIDGLTVLFADTTFTTEEEKIAMVYRLSYYGTNLPKDTQKAYLLIKADGTNTGIRAFKHVVQYAKKHNYFEKSVCFGLLQPIWIATIKAINPFLKNDVALFKTSEEAISYLKK